MSGIRIDSFGGVIPRLGPRLLPNNGGQIAQNTKLFSGELRGWNRASTVNTPTKGTGTGVTLKSMYRMYDTSTDYWLSWRDDVDVKRGPIAGDTAFKIYYTGDTTTASNSAAGPRKTNFGLATGGGTNYPVDYLEMGVPAPGAAPTVIGTGGTSTTSISRVYCYTYVTQTASWAEEGPPSLLGTGTGKEDATWAISALSTGTTGKYAFSGGVKRIYRALTDNAGNTNFQLALNNIAISTSSAQDTVADGALGVICPSFTNGVVNSEWVAPPSDLTGLVALPNGIMAGFSGNLICFSEPFYPHAWPIRYRLATNFQIVSMGAFGQSIVVTTKGFPYLVTGARPDSMSMSMIENNHPCSSKRSTVSFPFGVAWATPDGIVLAGVGGVVNVIEPFMKRDEWRDQCYPETIMAYQYQDVYFGFFNNGTQNLNFVFDKSNQQGPLTFGNFGSQGIWTDPETSKFYLLQNNQINEWDSDTLNQQPFDWESKTFVLQRPVNFAAFQVDADYDALDDGADSAAQVVIDTALNATIIGTANQDTALLTAWGTSSVYSTGDVVKSLDNVKMAVCIVAGTATTVEPTWPSTLGGTATDGPTLKWKRIWELEGRTKGELGGHVCGWHIQHSTADPPYDGSAGNQWGFPGAASLLVGGIYADYDDRNLLFQAYSVTTGTGAALVHSESLTTRDIKRLPLGSKSDTYIFRLSGNISVRYFRVAETATQIGQL